MKSRMYLLKLAVLIILLLSATVLEIQAQDYLISFSGSGESTSVDSVFVENLSTGLTAKLKGTEILHLKGEITGIESAYEYSGRELKFYPNPMASYSRMQFYLPEAGRAGISIHDLAGRVIGRREDFLSPGQHIYQIIGIDKGVYIVTVNTTRFNESSKLICSGSGQGSVQIRYENMASSREKPVATKGDPDEVDMLYNTGQRLLMRSTSESFSTIVTDVPSENKTINFIFVKCTDADGNHYPAVHIGTQIWMAKNLQTTNYSNGTSLPYVGDKQAWKLLKSGAYCYYEDNSGHIEKFGRLYNYYAVVSENKLCPAGWHIPLHSEWETLIWYLNPKGGPAEVGGYLKSKAVWYPPNRDAVNKVGFTALPGGYRSGNDQDYTGMYENGNWWSSTGYNTDYAYGRSMYYNTNYANWYHWNKMLGFSVRCIRD